MPISLKNTDQINCGAYILNGAQNTYMPFSKTKSIFLTQEGNNSLKLEILKLINESRYVLKICSFIITDKEIFDAIINKVQNSNTSIFILTQLDETKLTNKSALSEYLTEEELKDETSQTHLRYIKKLFENGVHVRASTSAHAKFIVSDRNRGFITSANFTTPSLTLNTESGTYLDGKSSCELDRLFDVIFQYGTSYRQFLGSSTRNKLFIVQSEVKIPVDLLPASSDSNLRYTYESETDNLYKEIVSVIDSASDYLYVSTYSIVGLEKVPEFTAAIANALKRGIKTYVFCRGMNYRNDHLIGSRILKELGCEIFADLYNHSKGIINEKSGIIFTANLDGYHGLKNGFEIGYILTEEERIEFLEIHKHLISSAYYQFQNKPTRSDLFDTYSVYEKTKGINAPAFPSSITISYNSNIPINGSEFSQIPLFYGKSKNEEYLICGSSFYKCHIAGGVITIYEKDSPRFDLERYILKYNSLIITPN